jgi:MFS family permease
MSSSPSTPRPTHYRYVILGLLCLLAMITYMDRAANGSARDAIMGDLNAHVPKEKWPLAREGKFSEDALGGMAGGMAIPAQPRVQPYDKNDFFLVLMAFQLAYAIFEVPSGWLGDTRGPRQTLLRVVIWWSAFVFLTGFVGMTLLPEAVVGGIFVGFYALLVIQFLFGVGEAGAFPNISKALYNWFPANARGFAKSAIWMSARLMGGLTPLVWVLLTEWKVGGMNLDSGLTWRGAMWLFAIVAAVWAGIFYLTFTNNPSDHRGVNAEELARINAGREGGNKAVRVPWGKLLRSRNLWAVCGMYVVTNFCWYFLMYNHPRSMGEQFGQWKTTGDGRALLAVLSGSPLLIGMLGCFLGGVWSDWLIRKTGSRKWARRIPGMVGYGMAGVCYLAALGGKMIDPTNLWAYAVPLMLMGFFNDLIMAPAWAVAQDIGRQYAATVSGAMNMVGNLVGAVTGIFVTGLIEKANQVDKLNEAGEKVGTVLSMTGYTVLFGLYATVYFAGVGLWLLIDANKPVVEEKA